MTDLLLLDKVALVTGGTRGIGKAIAKKFVEAGAHIAIWGTNSEKGQQTIEELKELVKENQKVSFYQVDVSSAKQVEQALTKVHEDFGQLDILVNNAGITRDNLLMRLSEEDWESVITINLKSVYNTCKSAIRPMIRARKGKIINITSVVGLTGNAGQTNYSASKSGMIGFTKSLAKEIASKGINVNCIAPGFIETEMTDKLNAKQKEGILNQIPMQKMGHPDHIANAALFLASPWSDYITGQVITVDGGMVMS